MNNASSLPSTLLNIAAYSVHTHALGPGNRAVIWVQGCPLRCPGCIAPDWIPFRPANIFTPSEVLEKIDLDAIDGITFSGGEPMEQAYGLSVVARTARLKKDINIICFSGYRYERLRNNPPNPGVPYLLDQIDVLIDGPYIQEKNDSIGLRGSSNQRVIHLSDRLRTFDLNSQKRRIEVTIESGQLSLIGIPTPEIIHALTETFRLSQKG